MKFYKNCQILNYIDAKYRNFPKRKIYNNLYNGYIPKNNKKENIRINQLYNESNLYPFSPLINHSGYMTFNPNSYRNSTPYTTRYNHYKNNNQIYQKFWDFTPPFPIQRNLLTETNFYKNRNYNNENEDDDDYIQDYPNYFNLTNRIGKNNNFKRVNLNRTDYDFYNPKNRSKNKNKRINDLYSNRDEDINTKISEYLTNFQKNNRFNPKNNNELYAKRNKSNNNIMRGTKYDIIDPNSGRYNNLYNINNKKNSEIDNYFNKKNNNKYINNLKLNKDRLSFKKNNNRNKSSLKYNNTNNKNDEEDKNSKKIYNESKDYFYSFNNKANTNNNINNNKDVSKKNSNTSLNPSSLCIDQLKTFYTNKPKTTNNNNNIGNSNINSASSRMLDTHYHFLNGIKMMSGEVNEYFYDFNSKKGGKDKNEEQKSEQTLQSLSDSKMMELANHYINDEDNSIENYQMNNIIYNRRRHNDK